MSASLIGSFLALAACSPEVSQPTTAHPDEVVLHGSVVDDGFGVAIANAGDVDGDGRPDLILGAPGNGKGPPGRVYVVTKPLNQPEIVIDKVAGFSIVGETSGHHVGSVLEGAGDVNGDGLADMLIGAQALVTVPDGCYEDCPTTTSPGPARAYLVLGRKETTDVQLADVAAGKGGFVIEGEAPGDLAMQAFAALGDLNGDGLADFAIASRLALGARGRVYVVFGKKDGSPVRLADVAKGQGGWVIEGEAELTGYFPESLARAGDVNGDGLQDLVLGGSEAVLGGRAYVVLGKASTEPVTAAGLAAGIGGFIIESEPDAQGCCPGLGVQVSGGGDLNGDGLDDLVVAAPLFRVDQGPEKGRSYVVFGKTTTSPVAAADITQGKGGFAVTGDDRSGLVTTGFHDLDGDGLADFLYDNLSADLFLVSGQESPQSMSAAPAFKVLTPGPWYLRYGSSVGDLDGNGLGDLALSGSSTKLAGAGAVLVVRHSK